MATIVSLLGNLYLDTAKRKENSGNRKTIIARLAERLFEYPGDLVVEVIQNYRGTFFPTLNDLLAMIESDRRLIKRHQKIRALEAFLRGDDPPPRKRVTPDQVAAIRAKYADEDQQEDEQRG